MKKVIASLMLPALLFSLASCAPPNTGGGAPPLRREKAAEDTSLPPTEGQLITRSTACGEIQGVQMGGYAEYRGVRYATAERWEAAVPVTGWEGLYDATMWGDRSGQYKGFYHMEDSTVNQFYADEALFTWPAGYSEDCLNLNIWTPDGAEDCPVLVYIHGGSFLTGSNSDTSTDGEAYARRGVITVSVSYRLGPFATAYGDGYTGNLALTDQLTALRWVRDNIADYGGDPSRITVMGESAGAVSVQNLLISPLVEDGLIHGAVMLSGGGDLSGLSTPITPDLVEPVWTAMKETAGVDSIADLNALPDKELYSLWLSSLGDYAATASAPVINGISLAGTVGQALEQNTVKDVPCILGMLSEDMWPYTLYQAAVDYSVRRSNAGGQPVYLYYFDRQQPGDDPFGAFHAADLYYVFGTLYRNWRPFDDTDYRIAETMIDYISNFVKTGDPNGSGLAKWETATADNQRFLHFGDDEPEMYDPSVLDLANTQSSHSPFPYADSIKLPDILPEADPEDSRIPISADDLAGTWTITGFQVIADGSFTAVENQTFAFSDAELYYHVDGALASACHYSFQDEYNIALKNFDAEESDEPLIWTLYLNDKGQLLIEDPTYAIIYLCEPLT